MHEPTWPQAREAARRLARPCGTEWIPVAEAVGRTLAQPVTALCPLPGYATAAMDGWAVAGPGPWTVVGEVLAGTAPPAQLESGTAVVIATGAAVPSGATAVVKREDGATTARVLADLPVVPGSHVRPQAEECRVGEVLLSPGSEMSPAAVGLAAAAGVDSVEVVRPPRVRLLLLGDELLDSGIPAVGQVRDSLGPQIPGWVDRLGGVVTGIVRVPDTVVDLTSALAACDDVELVLTTGGTAAGPVDCLHQSLAALDAELVVDSVAVRPGHPMLLARLGDLPVVGLPGNPQSAVVALMTLGAPLFGGMLGRPEPELGQVFLTQELKAPAHEHRLVAGSRSGTSFTAASHLGSAMLRGLATAEGFAVLPPGGAAIGTEVPWLPLP